MRAISGSPDNIRHAGVAVGVEVLVGVGVIVGVSVWVGVSVMVGVRVSVGVGWLVQVAVGVYVRVGVRVLVGRGVNVKTGGGGVPTMVMLLRMVRAFCETIGKPSIPSILIIGSYHDATLTTIRS